MSRSLRIISALFLVSAWSLVAGCASWAHADEPAAVVRGPLAVRQQQPMALTLLAFRPRRAATQPKGELGFAVQAAWSDIEEVQRFPAWAPTESVAFDGETVSLALRARYGLDERTDIEIELPFLYGFGGNLDSFIESYHNFFGLPDGKRNLAADDQYDMSVKSGGNELYELEGDQVGIGDVPIIFTVATRREDEAGPGIALRGGVELPTGSESNGFGNGAPDFGFGILGERSWGRWTVTGAADLVFPGQSDRMEEAGPEYRYEDMFSFQLGGEYRWNDHFSLVAGLIWTSRMINTVELEEINSEVVDLGLGFLVDTGKESRLGVSIHEDIVAATGSEITLQVGWSWGY